MQNSNPSVFTVTTLVLTHHLCLPSKSFKWSYCSTASVCWITDHDVWLLSFSHYIPTLLGYPSINSIIWICSHLYFISYYTVSWKSLFVHYLCASYSVALSNTSVSLSSWTIQRHNPHYISLSRSSTNFQETNSWTAPQELNRVISNSQHKNRWWIDSSFHQRPFHYAYFWQGISLLSFVATSYWSCGRYLYFCY